MIIKPNGSVTDDHGNPVMMQPALGQPQMQPGLVMVYPGVDQPQPALGLQMPSFQPVRSNNAGGFNGSLSRNSDSMGHEPHGLQPAPHAQHTVMLNLTPQTNGSSSGFDSHRSSTANAPDAFPAFLPPGSPHRGQQPHHQAQAQPQGQRSLNNSTANSDQMDGSGSGHHGYTIPAIDPADDKGPKQLIVNYIAPNVTEFELRALFEQFGPVDTARIIYDKHSGGTKGFGFIYFVYSEHAAKAIKYLQGFELYGKYLRVGYAVPQRPPPSASTTSTAGLSQTQYGSGSNFGSSHAANGSGSGSNARPQAVGGNSQSQSLAALANAIPPPYPGR